MAKLKKIVTGSIKSVRRGGPELLHAIYQYRAAPSDINSRQTITSILLQSGVRACVVWAVAQTLFGKTGDDNALSRVVRLLKDSGYEEQALIFLKASSASCDEDLSLCLPATAVALWGNLEKAIAVWKRLSLSRKAGAEEHCRLGTLFAKAGQISDASSSWKKSIELAASPEQAIPGIEHLMIHASRLEAWRACAATIRRFPKNAALYALAVELVASWKLKSPSRFIERLSRRFSSVPEDVILHADVFELVRERSKSVILLNGALKNSSTRAAAACRLINNALREGNLEAARAISDHNPSWRDNSMAHSVEVNIAKATTLRARDPKAAVIDLFLSDALDYSYSSRIAYAAPEAAVLHFMEEKVASEAGLSSTRRPYSIQSPSYLRISTAERPFVTSDIKLGELSGDYSFLGQDVESRIPFLQDYKGLPNFPFKFIELINTIAAIRRRKPGVLHAWALGASLYAFIGGVLARTPKHVLSLDIPPDRASEQTGWDPKDVAAVLRAAFGLPQVAILSNSERTVKLWQRLSMIEEKRVQAETHIFDFSASQTMSARSLKKQSDALQALYRSRHLTPPRRFVVKRPSRLV